MSTDFLSKKLVKILAIGLALLFTLGMLVYAAVLGSVKRVAFSTGFYYLVSEDKHVQASAESIQLSGGAGYLIEYGGREYAVLSVYLNEEEGTAVQTALKKNGTVSSLIYMGVEALYFKGCKQKRNGDMYESALKTLYGYLSVLSQCIHRLEEGMTQEACKRVLAPVERQFSYLGKRYQKKYPPYAKTCNEAAKALSKMSCKTLYVNDLRYYLCDLSQEYLSLAAEFSL